MKKTKHIAAGVILHPEFNQVFIAKRDAKSEQGGLWEFPGGKVELGESALQAVVRELKEEIGINATNVEHFLSLTHDYGDKVLDFDFFLIHQFEGEAYGKEAQPTKWVDIEQLGQYAFPDANLSVIEAVQRIKAAEAI